MLDILANKKEFNTAEELKDDNVYTTIFVEISAKISNYNEMLGLIFNSEMIVKMRDCIVSLEADYLGEDCSEELEHKKFGCNESYACAPCSNCTCYPPVNACDHNNNSDFETYLMIMFDCSLIKESGKNFTTADLSVFMYELAEKIRFFDSKAIEEFLRVWKAADEKAHASILQAWKIQENYSLPVVKEVKDENKKIFKSLDYFQGLLDSWDVKIQNLLVCFFFSGVLDDVEGKAIKKIMIKYFFFLSLFLKSEKILSNKSIRMFFVLFIFWGKCVQDLLISSKNKIEEEDKAIIEKFMLKFFLFLKSKPQAELVVIEKIGVKKNNIENC